MFFNSIDFAVFLPIVFILYWFVTHKNLKLQNILIIAASYVFYGWWDWRFLSLILFSTLVDYAVGRLLSQSNQENKRKIYLWISILVNLGFLGFFKYYNFFLDNFITAFSFFGNDFNPGSLKIILPVGISFYTFQTLSYTIDVYRKKLQPTEDFIAFAAFVSFFPQLVAGPIERATNLLPQFSRERIFNYVDAKDGLRQILWGLFKKVVIADTSAEFADIIFSDHELYSGYKLLLGAFFFTFQIYGDFSGYSDIAIGIARLFGFKLMQNFSFPYFSRDIAEFWRRWHISLSSWFRDYLYIPLGGSKGSKLNQIRNVFIIFIVSGFWHGANWTFIIWGGLNALYFLPLLLSKRNRNNIDIIAKGKYLPTLKDFLSMAVTFGLTVFAWIFFRAENLAHAFSYISRIFTDFYVVGDLGFPGLTRAKTTIGFIIVFMLIEWFGRNGKYGIEQIELVFNKPMRWTFYYILIIAIVNYIGKDVSFIYFQF